MVGLYRLQGKFRANSGTTCQCNVYAAFAQTIMQLALLLLLNTACKRLSSVVSRAALQAITLPARPQLGVMPTVQ